MVVCSYIQLDRWNAFRYTFYNRSCGVSLDWLRSEDEPPKSDGWPDNKGDYLGPFKF